jgi:NAD(P)-dependent dehydrogenase (short-subunit alcohol dehydrogenase family)
MQTQDPRTIGEKPPFAPQQQSFPGLDEEMNPQADHGEKSYQGSGKLKGLTAIVTGGDSGIGRAVVLAFAREGADIVISYMPEEQVDAEVSAENVRAAGRKVHLVPGDICDPNYCKELVEQTVRTLGRLDVLVNNAAFQASRESVEEVSHEEFERTYRTNVFAPFYLCKAALPHLKAGASILNVASIQAFDPSPELLAYASTKSALVGFSKALAKVVIKQGVRVNVVAPGPVWTPFIPAGVKPEKVEQFGANTLFERPAQPAELAPMFVWLASPEASYMTGEVIGVTGGRTPL